MEKTWKHTVAGILNIISGAVGLIAVIGLIIAIGITGGFYIPGTEQIPKFVPALLTGITILFAILSILSLSDGIYAVQRKKWGSALAGSISAIFTSIPLLGGLPVGITATIITALSKNEFD
jgi:uncharacterized protein involved in cysteine biosynthesis